jgi:hypothetical protein
MTGRDRQERGTLDAVQYGFLAAHRWALLSTVRPSGGIQSSLLAYHWNGHDLVFSTRRSTAKWVNIGHDPSVTVAIVDDESYLAVTGRADLVSRDPERLVLTERLLASLLPEHAAILRADIERGLDRADRGIIRVLPATAAGRIA